MKNLLGENKFPLSIDTAAETVAILLGEARIERYLKTDNYSAEELLQLDEVIRMMTDEKYIIYGLTRNNIKLDESERMRVFNKVKDEYCPILKKRSQKLKLHTASVESKNNSL